MRSVSVIAAFVFVFISASLCASAALPEMTIDNAMQEIYTTENAVVVNPQWLEFGVNMGAAQWGFAFAGIETKWREPLSFDVIGSGAYSSYDLFSDAAITLDYGIGSGYTERHFFGVGVCQNQRGQHAPSWGNGGSVNIMHENLIVANSNVQHVTIDPTKYAPKGWNGKLWIGLIIHNAGVNQYVIARITNARTASANQIPPIFNSVKALQSGGIDLTKSYDLCAKAWNGYNAQMPKPLQPYLGLFDADEASKAQSRYASANDKDKLKYKIVLSQFAKDTMNGASQLASAKKLLAKWQTGGVFGSSMGCIIRQVSNLQKVGVQELSLGKVLTASSNSVKLSAARREHEGFQLVLTPTATCYQQPRIIASELKMRDGVIPSSNISIHAVAYARVFEGKAVQLYQPDPLLEEGNWPKLTPGQNQSYWISVKVPETAKPGTYKGVVRILADGKEIKIPVNLQVRNFEIPQKISLRSSFWLFRDQINRFYNLDEVDLKDYMKWVDLALEYRLNPIDVFEGRCTQLVDIIKTDPVTGDQTLNETPDWSKWDTYVDHMLKGGANTIHLGVSHHQGTYFANKQNPVSSPGQIANVEKSIELARQHYIQKGIYDLHYMQLRDETSEPASLNVYRAVYKDMPDVKLLLTAPSNDARDCLRIPTPLTPSYDKQWQDEVVKKGGEYWWYVCVGPSDRRYANLFIDDKAVQHRAWWWQTWTNHVDGLLYWGLNYYKWYNDPTLSSMKPRTVPMPSLSNIDFSPIESAPGDGFSIYPGATPDKPIPSIRLEMMRDGEEDYEYLVLLEKLIGQYPNKTKAVAKANAVLQKARSLSTSQVKYEMDEAVYQRVRLEIADTIEQLLR